MRDLSIALGDDVLKRYENQIGALGQRKGHMALARAVNRTTNTVYSRTIRAVAKQSSIPASVVRSQVRKSSIRPGFGGALEGRVIATGSPLPIKVFRPRQFKWGVRAKIWGKQQRFQGLFIFAGRYNSGQDVANGHVFQRVTTKSLPLEKQFGPAVPSELVRNESEKIFRSTVESMLPDRVSHELQRLLPK